MGRLFQAMQRWYSDQISSGKSIRALADSLAHFFIFSAHVETVMEIRSKLANVTHTAVVSQLTYPVF